MHGAPLRASWMATVLAFMLAVIVQIIAMNYEVSIYDESLTLYGALRVAHGQVPYRDFWTMYPPGQFYLLAAAFHLFGVKALWGRVLFTLANAISAAAMLHILARITSRPWFSPLSVTAIVLWISARPSYVFPIYPAMSFILIAAACMLRRWSDARTSAAYWAGAAIGVAALFRHDLALYALVGLGAASFVAQFLQPKSQRERPLFADLLRLSATAALVVLPVVILLVLYVPAHDLYYDLFYVPGVIYPKVRALPFPNLHQVLHGFRHAYSLAGPVQGDVEYNIVWLPLLTVAAASAVLVHAVRTRSAQGWRWTGLLSLTLLTALLFLKGTVRVSPLHMAPGVIVAFLTLAFLLVELPSPPALRLAVLVVALWSAACLFGAAHRDYFVFRQNLRALRGTELGRTSFYAACHPPSGLERARCLYLPPDEAKAILFLQSESTPADRIFVAVPRFDILHLSDIEIYFFSGRESATRWYDLHPGVQTTAPIQQEMIDELQRSQVRFIVRDNTIYPDEPNLSRFSSGVTLLGDYIRQNYEPQRSFGAIEVLVRATPFAHP